MGETGGAGAATPYVDSGETGMPGAAACGVIGGAVAGTSGWVFGSSLNSP